MVAVSRFRLDGLGISICCASHLLCRDVAAQTWNVRFVEVVYNFVFFWVLPALHVMTHSSSMAARHR